MGIAVSAFATGFSARIYMTSGPNSRDTIESWACRWEKVDSTSPSLGGTASVSPPTGFGRVCRESQAGFDMVIITLFLEISALVLGVVGFKMERKM